MSQSISLRQEDSEKTCNWNDLKPNIEVLLESPNEFQVQKGQRYRVIKCQTDYGPRKRRTL